MIQLQGRRCRSTSWYHAHEGRTLKLVSLEKKFTISDNGRSKSFDCSSTESLENTSAEDGLIGGSIGAPDIGPKEHCEGGDQGGSFSEDQCHWNPEEVAHSQSEDIVVGQKSNL